MYFRNIGLTYIHYCLLRNPVLAVPTAVMGAQLSGRSSAVYIALLDILRAVGAQNVAEWQSPSATSQTSAYRHSKLCQSLGENKKNKVWRKKSHVIISIACERFKKLSFSFHSKYINILVFPQQQEGVWNMLGFAVGLVESISPIQPLYLLSLHIMWHLSIILISLQYLELTSFFHLHQWRPHPTIPGPPGFFAIQGCIYHCLQPNHQNSAVHCLLYDSFMHNMVTFQELDQALPLHQIDALRDALLAYNPFAGGPFHLSVLDATLCPNTYLTLEDMGTATKIVAVMNYENTTQSEVKAQWLIVIRWDGSNQTISTISCFCEPLAYPLLFPHGTLRWGIYRTNNHFSIHGGEESGEMESDVPTHQIMHYHALMLREPQFKIFGWLTNEYAIDMFTQILRLNWDRKSVV